MKMTAKSKQIKRHRPGELMETHIQWHPDGQSVTVTHRHAPELQKPDFATSANPFGPGPSSQDQAYTTRHEAMHDIAKHAGVVAEMVDDANEGQERNPVAGVGDLKSKKPKNDEDED